MTFVKTTNNRISYRWDGSTFQEEVMTFSGTNGISVLLTEQGFVLSGNQTALSGALQSEINGKVSKSGDTMSGFLVLHADPTLSGHAATKQYVDSAVAGVSGGGGGGGPVITISGLGQEIYTGTGNLTFNFLDPFSLNEDFPGNVSIFIDEEQFQNVVFLTGNQTIQGEKTFEDTVSASSILAGGIVSDAVQVNTQLITFSGAEPVSSGTGTAGEIRWSNDALYVCVATNTWKRSTLSSY